MSLDIDTAGEYVLRAIKLAHVMRLWRGVILGSPEFFDSFDIDEPPQPLHTKIWARFFKHSHWKMKITPRNHDGQYWGGRAERLLAFVATHRNTLKQIDIAHDSHFSGSVTLGICDAVFPGLHGHGGIVSGPGLLGVPANLHELSLGSMDLAQIMLRPATWSMMRILQLELPFNYGAAGVEVILIMLSNLFVRCMDIHLRNTYMGNSGHGDFSSWIATRWNRSGVAGGQKALPYVARLKLTATRVKWLPHSNVISLLWKMDELEAFDVLHFPPRSLLVASLIEHIKTRKEIRHVGVIEDIDINHPETTQGPEMRADLRPSHTYEHPLAVQVIVERWPAVRSLTYHSALCTYDILPQLRRLGNLRRLDFRAASREHCKILIAVLTSKGANGWCMPLLQELTVATVPLVIPVV